MYSDDTYRVTKAKELTPALERSTGYWVASTSNIAPSAEFVGQLVDKLIEDGAHYIGIWTSSIGRVFVDNAHYFEDLEDATRAGKHWHQEAIWDIANNKAISLT